MFTYINKIYKMRMAIRYINLALFLGERLKELQGYIVSGATALFWYDIR